VVVETGKPREVLANPQHERTKAFLSKVLQGAARIECSTSGLKASTASDVGNK
jgi:ABC-type oligopeptide transport system ATPase subunit